MLYSDLIHIPLSPRPFSGAEIGRLQTELVLRPFEITEADVF